MGPSLLSSYPDLVVLRKGFRESGKNMQKTYWLVVWATPLKNMKVNWDDYKPNINGKIKHGNQTTNQHIRL